MRAPARARLREFSLRGDDDRTHARLVQVSGV